MDYFSVIVLVIVTFVFISDRSVKNIEMIEDSNIIDKICDINNELEIIQLDEKNINYININQMIKRTKKQYILIKNSKLELNECGKNTLIANYIVSNMKPCGFTLLYQYNRKWSLNKMYVDIINYLNIFNKEDLDTYGVIICTKQDFLKGENYLKNELVNYTPCEITSIVFSKQEIKNINLKNIYINKIFNANFTIIIKILLLIISGSIITTNLIYSILNANNSINGIIISGVIYYCYSYIIRYIYKPIGRQRIIATYIFPIYFVSYIVIGAYTFGSRVIKKVHAS